MKPGETFSVLRSPDGQEWVQDHDQVLVVDSQRHTAHRLEGVEAAVWGWLAAAYSYAKIIRLLENLLVVSSAAAEQKFQELIQKWCAVGLIEPELSAHG